ncbi:hypothetical protein [Actinomadura madurae]|uniref:hypothetical protein n=1 Tax=Actinomadura madurae TaxID=1993 RepID=UPI0020D22199|nr:hypothetical protein [Actinomadura madurae]MCP9947354.1 hypothetical protein [Actinomadura madurae]MCP9964120.1 hypothetical protein [Actinomadura madurae]MCP9976592.1 hypothetical protein [Actinomadura madurae]MCQ0011911.1 hypothetical protein [Actinomadura madurae]MCQ0012788.1 hypothetical protein [Actinomadura madurae]
MSDEKPPELHLIQGGRTDHEQTDEPPSADDPSEGLPEDPDERLAHAERLLAEANELLGKPPDSPA